MGDDFKLYSGPWQGHQFGYPLMAITSPLSDGDDRVIQWVAMLSGAKKRGCRRGSVSVRADAGFDLQELQRVAEEEAKSVVLDLIEEECGALYARSLYPRGFEMRTVTKAEIVRMHHRGRFAKRLERLVARQTKAHALKKFMTALADSPVVLRLER